MSNLVRRLLDRAANGAPMRHPKPADTRPYRRQSETGPEMTTTTDDYRQTWRQVGWLGDIAPGLLTDLEHSQVHDAPDGVVYDHLPYAVDELIDHLKEKQR